ELRGRESPGEAAAGGSRPHCPHNSGYEPLSFLLWKCRLSRRSLTAAPLGSPLYPRNRGQRGHVARLRSRSGTHGLGGAFHARSCWCGSELLLLVFLTLHDRPFIWTLGGTGVGGRAIQNEGGEEVEAATWLEPGGARRGCPPAPRRRGEDRGLQAPRIS